jgi:hypothetical protein
MPEHSRKAPARGKKPQARAKKRRRCRLVDDMAEHSGEGTDGGDCEGPSEEEMEQDRAFLDDQEVKDRRKRLPKLTAAEKVVSEDELENLKDACVTLCKEKSEPKRDKKAYADRSDEDEATKSDLDFLASSSCDEELEQTERKTKEALDVFLGSMGLQTQAKGADSHKAARKSAYESTLQFLRSKDGQLAAKSSQAGAKPAQGKLGAGRVRQTESKRQLAPLFLGGKNAAAAKAKARPEKEAKSRQEPGLYYNTTTKEAYYRHADGRISPRENAL